jgi:type I restriction enzyme, S subunit
MAKKMNKIEKLLAELCPEGVVQKPLSEVATIKRGVRVVRSQLTEDGEYPVYQNSMTPLGYYEASNCPANTAFVISAGAAGKIGYSTVDFWAADDCFYFICPEQLQSRFLYYALLCQQNYLFSRVRRGSVPRLARSVVEGIKIPIPPLAIQQEIVKILDTFTTLEARKKQYEYYRDELLDIRDVEFKKLGEVGSLIRGNGLQKKDFIEDGIGCIHYGQIYTYYGTYADKTKTFVSPELAKKLKKAQMGDVLISGVSENIEDVCKPLGWLGDEICISGDMFAFRHNQNTKFITYLLQTTNFKRYKERFAHGAKVIRVKQDKILDYKIPIPPLAEQERIVAILDKFDALVNDISVGLPAELNARRKQYEYYRDKLLTFKKFNSSPHESDHPALAGTPPEEGNEV